MDLMIAKIEEARKQALEFGFSNTAQALEELLRQEMNLAALGRRAKKPVSTEDCFGNVVPLTNN